MLRSFLETLHQALHRSASGRKIDALPLRSALLLLPVLLAGSALAHVFPMDKPRRSADNSVRMRISFEATESVPAAPRTGGAGLRRRVVLAPHQPLDFVDASRPVPAPGSLLLLRDGRIFLTTAYGTVDLDKPGFADNPYEIGSPALRAWGEQPESGRFNPSRPLASAQVAVLECPAAPSHLDALRLLATRLGIAPDGSAGSLGTSRYLAAAEAYAAKYNLSTGLVMAIMRAESNFNPFAVSRNNALGLMQIVPDTAGGEAHSYLTGEKGAPDSALLFDPEHNIKYGTTYLHLLNRRYFGEVVNPAAREMCVVAAYNGGPGAVLRVFDPASADSAVAVINSLTPEEVYEALITRLPTAESRRYVDVVLGNIRAY